MRLVHTSMVAAAIAAGWASAAPDTAPAAAGRDASVAAAGLAGCGPTHPESCRYRSDLDHDVGLVSGVSLFDADRGGYEVPLEIRYPVVDVAEPRPVVIWNHGGLPSPRGATRSEEWGELLAAAGYVVVQPSRQPVVDATPHLAECQASGFGEPRQCAGWIAQQVFGPRTAHFLIDHLDEVAALDPALVGLLDGGRIVVAGHSGGSTVPLALAGATRQWVPGGPVYDERHDAPVAFIATGVQGPMYAGFDSGFRSAGEGFDVRGFAGIDRPFLFVTGIGDDTGEPAESRTTAWLTADPAGDLYLSWDTDPHAKHETMNLRKCETPTQADHCRWIGSAGLAFLDAVVRQRRAAQDWLGSDAYRILTGGAIELHTR